VQWRINGKLFMKSTGQTRKDKAEQERDKIMSPFVAGDEVTVLQNVAAKIQGKQAEIARYEDEKTPPLLVSQAWASFLTAPNRPDSGDATLRQYGFQFNRFAAWVNSNHPKLAMRDVSDRIGKDYAEHLKGKGLTNGTYNKHMRLLHLVFDVLTDKAKSSGDNPWRKRNVGRNTENQQSRRELTVDELREICRAAKGEMKLLFAVGIYTGLRLGDCATLRWGEVDLQRGIIRRIPNKISRRKNKPVHVPIHPDLSDMLKETPTKERKEYVLRETAAAYLAGSDNVTKKIQAHFESCRIDTHKPGTGKYRDKNGKLVNTGKRAVVEVGFHSLRHTFVSLCRESNAPLAVVEAIVGHANPAMTRHYTHVGEAAAGKAVAALPSVTGDSPKTVKPEPETVDAESVRKLAKKLTVKNVAKIKKELLALLS